VVLATPGAAPPWRPRPERAAPLFDNPYARRDFSLLRRKRERQAARRAA
jgi:hypothetical protein